MWLTAIQSSENIKVVAQSVSSAFEYIVNKKFNIHVFCMTILYIARYKYGQMFADTWTVHPLTVWLVCISFQNHERLSAAVTASTLWKRAPRSISEAGHWCWAMRPGSHSKFQFILKVLDSVEVRALCKPVQEMTNLLCQIYFEGNACQYVLWQCFFQSRKCSCTEIKVRSGQCRSWPYKWGPGHWRPQFESRVPSIVTQKAVIYLLTSPCGKSYVG